MNVAEIEEMHVDMARWVAANTPPESVIASHDVGALGYFSGRKVLDTVGLVTPGVIEYLRPGFRRTREFASICRWRSLTTSS